VAGQGDWIFKMNANAAPDALPVTFRQKHTWLWFSFPALAWAIFIAWGSLAPPDILPSISFPFADKAEHASIYAVLSFLLMRDWQRMRRGRWGTWLFVFLICAAYGFYLECLQALSGYRDFEIVDAIANATGAAIGSAIWLRVSMPRSPQITSVHNK
jgi:VanZ family protein